MEIPVEKVLPSPEQPRTIFDQNELDLLAATIKDKGQIHPVIVEQAPDGYFILIDGERRLMACKIAGLPAIRAEVREHVSNDRLELALISNLQRASMGPVDEGRAYQKLLKKYKTLSEVSRRIGISDATIKLKLDLLDFPEEIQKIANARIISISAHVVKAIRKLPKDSMIRVITTAAARGWSSQAIIIAAGREAKRLERNKKKNSIKSAQVRRINTTQKEVLPPIVEESEPEAEKPREIARVYNTYSNEGGHFNALAMVADRRFLPSKVVTCALATCKDCPLYRDAGKNICGQCPVVDLLNKLVVELKKGMN